MGVRGCNTQTIKFISACLLPLYYTFDWISFLVQILSNQPSGSCTNDLKETRVSCTATVETHGQTGVEMEALTAVNVALLTVYDMCKAVDRGMTINSVKLMEKHGGKSGSFVAG